jgi:hypothetical protein
VVASGTLDVDDDGDVVTRGSNEATGGCTTRWEVAGGTTVVAEPRTVDAVDTVVAGLATVVAGSGPVGAGTAPPAGASAATADGSSGPLIGGRVVGGCAVGREVAAGGIDAVSNVSPSRVTR